VCGVAGDAAGKDRRVVILRLGLELLLWSSKGLGGEGAGEAGGEGTASTLCTTGATGSTPEGVRTITGAPELLSIGVPLPSRSPVRRVLFFLVAINSVHCCVVCRFFKIP
jgi:hypothetical protein